MTLTEIPTPVERARALHSLIREAADEAERERRLPNHVAAAMAEAGLHRLAVPAGVGGGEAEPAMQVRTIEAVSEADGAAGWNLLIGIETAGAAGLALEPDVARQVFSDPLVVVAGALNPLGRARREPGGLRVTGQWPFASGCHNAHWFLGQCVIYDGDEPERNELGGPVIREVFVPASDFTILDTWHVSGMRGSGSHDLRVDDIFVPDRFVTNIAGGVIFAHTPLYRLPRNTRLAYNKTGVSMGIARAAIDHFVALANGKTPRFSRTLLRDRVSAQLQLAEAEATLRAGRAFVFEALDDIWATVCAGERPTREQRALHQLACTHLVASASRAVQLVHSAAGTSANVAGTPLERCFRDIHVVPQHITVSPQWYEAAGRVLMGIESDSPMI